VYTETIDSIDYRNGNDDAVDDDDDDTDVDADKDEMEYENEDGF